MIDLDELDDLDSLDALEGLVTAAENDRSDGDG